MNLPVDTVGLSNPKLSAIRSAGEGVMYAKAVELCAKFVYKAVKLFGSSSGCRRGFDTISLFFDSCF